MKVIGAGLPRTATLTQKVALEMLGVGPCYHMVNVLTDLTQTDLWRDALEGRPDWDRLLGGFESTVDWPGGFFYREILEAYPEAKVLLSVRDPSGWERSMRDTVWGTYFGDITIGHLSRGLETIDGPWRNYIELMTQLLWEGRGTLRQDHQSREGLMAAFEAHTEDVRRNVPADKLLVWQPSDGWEPLCAFLEVDVPATPIPHLNDSATYKSRLIEMSLTKFDLWWKAEQSANGDTAAPAAAPAAVD
jgi:hypothetical protein